MSPNPPQRSPDDFDVEIETESTAVVTRAYRDAHARRLVVSSAVVAFCFTLIAVWSLGAEPSPTAPPAASLSAMEPPAVEPIVSASLPAAVVQEMALARPRRLAPLMSLSLTELLAGGSWTSTRLDAVLDGGLTVVNLWATYCEPCMRELAAFQAVAAAERDVRFVFVMLEAYNPRHATQADALAALRRVGSGARLLVDQGDDVGRVLRDGGLYSGAATLLPLTLVMRCGEVAWGQLGPIEAAGLRAVLAAQRSSGRCERATRGAALPRSAAPRLDGCGDRTCDRLAGETCASCEQDCGCVVGSCIRNAAGNMHCARDGSTLKD